MVSSTFIVQGILNLILSFLGARSHDFVVVRQEDIANLQKKIEALRATVNAFER